MYWILFCVLAAYVSGVHRRDPVLFEELYRGDSGEADVITYHRDDNAHVDIRADRDLNKFVNYVHKKEHGFTKEFLSNNTITSDDFERILALRTAHKRRCEMSVTSIIEKEKYCQLCTCYIGQWVCMFATSCYYKYDFSNKNCKDPATKDIEVLYDNNCYICKCEEKTNLMRCVRNPATENEEHCKSSRNLDVLHGE